MKNKQDDYEIRKEKQYEIKLYGKCMNCGLRDELIMGLCFECRKTEIEY